VNRTILIVGGAGTVGSKIAKILSKDGGLRLILGGRNRQKAEAIASSVGAEARRIDLNLPDTWEEALAGVGLVLVCMDQEDERFARHVLSSGIRYLDITAGDALFRAIEALPAEDVQATAVLSVGLAPGITNLLAVEAASRLDTVEGIDIGLLLGLGEAHGAAAVEWTIRGIFSPREGGPAVMDFGSPWGGRRAYWIDFADQHVLQRTMGVPAASRLTFDSRPISALLFKLGSIFRDNGLMTQFSIRLSPILSFGSDTYVALAEARGTKDGRKANAVSRFFGRNEANATAHVAAITARSVLERDLGKGVYHIHQVLEPAALFTALERDAVGNLWRGFSGPSQSPQGNG
jgi:saccharopine dehydrogenase (NAD+, L-lysine forming)